MSHQFIDTGLRPAGQFCWRCRKICCASLLIIDAFKIISMPHAYAATMMPGCHASSFEPGAAPLPGLTLRSQHQQHLFTVGGGGFSTATHRRLERTLIHAARRLPDARHFSAAQRGRLHAILSDIFARDGMAMTGLSPGDD